MRLLFLLSIFGLTKKINKIGFGYKILEKLLITSILHKIKPHDIIIYNDSQIGKGVNKFILSYLQCYKVLLLRNPVNELFINELRNDFDSIYSFERDKCINYGVKYLEQFFPIGYYDINFYLEQNRTISKEKRCFFLGRDKGRLDDISKLAGMLVSYNCIVDFLVVRDRGSKSQSEFYIEEELSYEEYLNHTILADILVDITQQGQSGWTLRVLEALYFNKKLITNNIEIINSDFYSPNRFFILGHDDWGNFNNFTSSICNPLSKDVFYKYSPDHMIKKIINDYELFQNR